MIPIGTPAQQVPPKHKADSLWGEFRDYSIHVCPGQHCLGRSEPAAVGHRHTVRAVHTLTPAQADAAAKHSGSGRWVGWSM